MMFPQKKKMSSTYSQRWRHAPLIILVNTFTLCKPWSCLWKATNVPSIQNIQDIFVPN